MKQDRDPDTDNEILRRFTHDFDRQNIFHKIQSFNSGVALLAKALFSGIVTSILAWVAILTLWMWRSSIEKKKLGLEGLGAIAGGWAFLLHSPLVTAVISIAFGLGFYCGTRLLGGAR